MWLPTLTCHGLKSSIAQKVPLLKSAHVQAHLKFTHDHLHDPEELSREDLSGGEGQTKASTPNNNIDLYCDKYL